MMHPCLLLMALAEPAPRDTDLLAALHPAKADVYLELTDPQALLSASEQFPWMRLLRDPEMAKLSALMAALGFDLGAQMSSLLPSDLTGAGSPLRALQRMNVSISGLDERTAPIEMWMSMRMQSSESAQAMQALMESAGVMQALPGEPQAMPFGERSLAVRRYALDLSRIPMAGQGGIVVGKQGLWLVQDGADLVMGMGLATPEQLAQRVRGEQPSLPASAELFPDSLPWPKGSGLSVYRLMVDLDGQAMLESPSFAQTRETLGTALSWGLPALFPYLGAKGVWRVQWSGTQFVTDTVHTRYPSMSTQALGAAPVDPKVAHFVPAEAVGAWITSIDPVRFEAELRQLVGVALEGSEEQAPLLEPRQLALLPPLNQGLGRQAAMFLLPISNIQSIEPRVFVAMELENREAFEAALDAWAAKLEELAPQARVSNRPYRKHKLVSISGANQAEEGEGPGAQGPLGGLMSPPSFSPTIGVLSDRVLITIKKSFAQTEMRRVLDGKDVAPHPIAAPGAVPPGVFESSSMNWPTYTGKLLDIAAGLLPMAASMMGEEDTKLDLAGLPSTATLQRYFASTTSWSRRLADGSVLSSSTSSYGPETPATLALLAIAGTQLMSAPRPTGVEPKEPAAPQPSRPEPTAPPGPSESDEELATRAGLLSIRAGIAVYRADAGKIPAELKLLTQPTANFPEAFLSGKPLPQDGWKRDFVYRPEPDNRKYALYSLGANGKDEGGEGDDIRLK